MTRQRSRRLGLLAAVAALLPGCVPSLPQGPAREASHYVPDSYGDSAGGESAAQLGWRALFPDPNLAVLIEGALARNQELNIQVQRAVIEQNEIMARRGEFLPSLGFGASAGIEKVGRHTSQGASDEMADVPEHLQGYSLGVYATWEIDIWRRLRNLRDAAVLRYLASVEGRNFMVTRLVAEIANGYYELIALDRQLEVVRNNVELLESALEVVQLQQQAARVTRLAVNRFEAELRDFQARQYDIQQRIVETENELNFLAGRFPQPVARSSADFLSLDPTPVTTGLPTELLENRPDVRRAELELRAAELDVKAARARFYPSLSLEAGVGYESYDIRKLFNTPGSILYNLIGNLMAPLLNRSQITAEYYTANATQMQAVLHYERAVLTAYIDVNNSLNLIANVSEAYALRAQQVERLTESIEISTRLFNSARADYLEVLTTRRDALEAEMELIETKQQQMTAAVSLYQALGGGWRGTEREGTNDPRANSEDERSARTTGGEGR